MKRSKKINKTRIISGIIILIALIIGYLTQDKTEETHTVLGEDIMRVHFIDVGEGDSTFIEFPDGKTMLVDAGEQTEGEKVLEYIKNCKSDRVDFLVGTHPHSDHIGGLETVVRNLEIGSVYMPKVSHNTKTFENLILAIREKGMKIKTAKAGTVIYSNNGVEVSILSPIKEHYDNLNNYSVILKITYNNKTFLLTGDAENVVLNQESVGVDADVLKVSHHGSTTSDSRIFLKRVSPEYAVISVGENNQYGHPHDEVIDYFENSGIKYYRTDQDGTIIIDSDGENIIVRGEE